MKKKRRDDCGGLSTICLKADSKEEAAGGFTSVQQAKDRTFGLCFLYKGGTSSFTGNLVFTLKNVMTFSKQSEIIYYLKGKEMYELSLMLSLSILMLEYLLQGNSVPITVSAWCLIGATDPILSLHFLLLPKSQDLLVLRASDLLLKGQYQTLVSLDTGLFHYYYYIPSTTYRFQSM